jgi:hypothetical protein
MADLEATRRDFVVRLALAAGVAPAIVSLLQGTAEALPPGEESDIRILNAAIVLEHQAAAVYEVGLSRGFFAGADRNHAISFRADHMSHRDTQIAISKKRGGNPPGPRSHYEFEGMAAGQAAVRVALGVEVGAQEAYSTLLSHIGTMDYLLSAAFILVDEIRHMTVWRQVLGYKIY